MKRNTTPPLIAAALNLPLRVVLNVISRLEKKPELGADECPDPTVSHNQEAGAAPFLDAYFINKARYGILQLVGHLVKEKKALLDDELQKARITVCKAIAIKLTNVVAMDEAGAKMLLDFCETMQARNRYIALLDPPMRIEPLISHFQFEGKIPVFGTLGAFESGAVSYNPGASSSRQKNRPKTR
jgi:anti-anti-sigma regulatory factor